MSALLDYIRKTCVNSATRGNDYFNEWQAIDLKKETLEDVTFALEQLLEHGHRLSQLKDLFECYPENLKHHPDVFKWSCAFGERFRFPTVTDYFYQVMEVKNGNSAIHAAIINYKPAVVAYLFDRYEFSEAHLFQALARSDSASDSKIVDFLMDNLDKIRGLSDHTVQRIETGPLYEEGEKNRDYYRKKVQSALLNYQLQAVLPEKPELSRRVKI